MTDESVPSAGSPSELLTAVRDLTRQVRIAQRGTWLPLLVMAVVTLAAIPVYRYAPRPHILGTCRSGPQHTTLCHGVNVFVFVYWLVALILAYAVIAGFYIRQSRRRGVGTPIRPYVIVGIALAVTMAAVTVWLGFHPLLPFSTDAIQIAPTTRLVSGLATPTAAIGLALLALTWVERNRALLAYSLVYLVVVLVQAGQVIHSTSPWYFLPHLLVPATLLLLGSAGFVLFRPTTERNPL